MATRCSRLRLPSEDSDEHREWWYLPEPALLSLSQKLANFTDYYAFAGTCRRWRAVAMAAVAEFMASQPPLVCWLDGSLLHGPLENRSYRSKLLVRPRIPTAIIVNVCHGYLVIDEYDIDRSRWPCRKRIKLWLVNPFTGDEVHSIPAAPGTLLFWVVLTAPPRSRDCTVVACIEPLDRDIRSAAGLKVLIYCRPGDSGWRFRRSKRVGFGGPVASPDGKNVYIWYRFVDIVIFEFADHRLVKETFVEGLKCLQPVSNGRYGYRMLLAMSDDGELFFVEVTALAPDDNVDDADGTVAVHRLDLPGSRWVRMESLGGRALLLTTNQCIVSDDPGRWGGKKDHVYLFTGESTLKVFQFLGRGDDIPASSVTSVPLPPQQHRQEYEECDRESFWVLPSLSM